MAKVIRIGDTYTDSTGATYTVTSLVIAKQEVKFDYQAPSSDHKVPQVMPVKLWHQMVNTVVPPAPSEEPVVGSKFQMMNGSVWEITGVADAEVAFHDGTVERTFHKDYYQELVRHRYVKLIH